VSSLSSRYRWAPTPSGFLHVGNLFSMIHTWLEARKNEAELFLRIDDLDLSRSRREYVEEVFSILNFLKLDWDCGPRNSDEFFKKYSQSLFQNEYKKALDRAREWAPEAFFVCECSRSQLAQDSKNFLYSGACHHKNLVWQEGLSRRVRSDLLGADIAQQMGDFIVLRKDNLHAYHWVSLFEDVRWKITHWVRGEDLITSTLAQKALARYLAQKGLADYQAIENIQVEHHPLILMNNKKLSKSEGAASVKSYLKEPQDLIQAFMRWRALPIQKNIKSFFDLKKFYVSMGKEASQRGWKTTQLDQLLG
jgi:glutamyl/glutaminyl-tRNA synthetase